MTREKRASQRIETNEPGQISWQDTSGNTSVERIVLVNLADKGAMIEMSRKLDLRLTVQLQVLSRRIDGSASVRYCRQKGLRYRIGLELFDSINAKPKVQRWT